MLATTNTQKTQERFERKKKMLGEWTGRVEISRKKSLVVGIVCMAINGLTPGFKGEPWSSGF